MQKISFSLFSRQRLGMIILFLCDLVILFLIMILASLIRHYLPRIIPDFPVFLGRPIIWWFFPIWIAIMTYEGAYTNKFTFWDEVKFLWKVSISSTITILIVVSLGQLSHTVSRTIVLMMGLLAFLIFPLFRMFVKRKLLNSGLLKSNVLIFGTNPTALRALMALRREPNLGYEVISFVDDDRANLPTKIDGIKVRRSFNNIGRYLKQCDIQDVIIATPEMDKRRLFKLLNNLQHRAEHVLFIPDLSGMAVIGTELRHFFQDQLLAVEIKNNLAQPLNYITKKMLDYVAAFLLIFTLIIPIFIISIIIKLTSPGPAIYRHQRMGKNGRPFMCYKFRTMYKDSEERLKLILEKDADARNEWSKNWKLKSDPRITKIGKFLRSTSLDELPQIFNVLKGEMSLVGPRPVVKHEIDTYYKEDAEFYYSVLPGITGLWQVSGRSNTSYDSRVSLDAWYVRNWNVWLDIVIMLKTVNVVLKKEGAQ